MKMAILRGLPGSGKSTLAKQYVERGYKRFNKDDLRTMIDGGVYSAENEEFIFAVQQSLIAMALHKKLPIVIDNTHGRDSVVAKLIKMAELHDYTVDVVVIDTPIETCIRRDSVRHASVGEEVIRSFAKQPFFQELYSKVS